MAWLNFLSLIVVLWGCSSLCRFNTCLVRIMSRFCLKIINLTRRLGLHQNLPWLGADLYTVCIVVVLTCFIFSVCSSYLIVNTSLKLRYYVCLWVSQCVLDSLSWFLSEYAFIIYVNCFNFKSEGDCLGFLLCCVLILTYYLVIILLKWQVFVNFAPDVEFKNGLLNQKRGIIFVLGLVSIFVSYFLIFKKYFKVNFIAITWVCNVDVGLRKIYVCWFFVKSLILRGLFVYGLWGFRIVLYGAYSVYRWGEVNRWRFPVRETRWSGYIIAFCFIMLGLRIILCFEILILYDLCYITKFFAE